MGHVGKRRRKRKREEEDEEGKKGQREKQKCPSRPVLWAPLPSQNWTHTTGL